MYLRFIYLFLHGFPKPKYNKPVDDLNLLFNDIILPNNDRTWKGKDFCSGMNDSPRPYCYVTLQFTFAAYNSPICYFQTKNRGEKW